MTCTVMLYSKCLIELFFSSYCWENVREKTNHTDNKAIMYLSLLQFRPI